MQSQAQSPPVYIKNENDIVDYAFPTMMAEKALKSLHSAMLAKDYERALEMAVEARMQCRLAYYAIEGMK